MRCSSSRDGYADETEVMLVTTETQKELWLDGGGGRAVRVEARERQPKVTATEVLSR